MILYSCVNWPVTGKPEGHDFDRDKYGPSKDLRKLGKLERHFRPDVAAVASTTTDEVQPLFQLQNSTWTFFNHPSQHPLIVCQDACQVGIPG